MTKTAITLSCPMPISLSDVRFFLMVLFSLQLSH